MLLGLRLEDKRYFTNHDRDAFTTTATFAETIEHGPWRFRIRATAQFENATSDVYSCDRYESALRLERDFAGRTTGWLGAGLTGSKYEESDPLFLRRRSDEIKNFAVGVRRIFWRRAERALAGELEYTYTNANSTLALYTYDKNVFASRLSFSF